MHIRLGAVAVGLVLFYPLAASATPVPNTTILFNDTTDTVTVTVTPSGAGAPTTANEVCNGETCAIDVISPNPGALLTGLTAPNGDPINILEPGGSSIISDILSSDTYEPVPGINVGDFAVTFTSDTNETTGLGIYTSGGMMVEDGTVQNGFTFSWEDPSNGYATVATATIQFQSDLDSTTAVPEPLTLSLFGAGLAGAVALRRRKQKA